MSSPKPDPPIVEFSVTVPVTRHDRHLALHSQVAHGSHEGRSLRVDIDINGTTVIVHTGDRTYIVSTLDLARQIATAAYHQT